MIIKDESGNDLEVFTAEELQTQKDAILEEYKIANPDVSVELDALQKELESKTEELTKLKDKDLNFANLRSQKDAAEKKLEAELKKIDEKIGAVKSEVLEGVRKDYYNETLKSLAGNDKELEKKIGLEYDRLKDAATTKEDVGKKLRDAYFLATKVEDAGALNSAVISSGAVSRLNVSQNKSFTPEEIAFTKKLAESGGMKLEDKDFK